VVDALLWWAGWTYNVVFGFVCLCMLVDDAYKKFGRKP